MKRLRTTLLTVLTVLGLVALPLTPAVTFADGTDPASEIQQGVSGVGGSSTANQDDLKGFLKTIVNVMLFILGAIAVIMIIIGGIRYTTSNGDAAQTKGAKDTILYAVVGLIVAILAYAIVNFVISSFVKN
jgi:multisubunit Na+/H+ antiporter MnhB subunit